MPFVISIKAALLALYENRPLSISMGMSAREFIASNYTWAHYQKQLVNAYLKMGPKQCAA